MGQLLFLENSVYFENDALEIRRQKVKRFSQAIEKVSRFHDLVFLNQNFYSHGLFAALYKRDRSDKRLKDFTADEFELFIQSFKWGSFPFRVGLPESNEIHKGDIEVNNKVDGKKVSCSQSWKDWHSRFWEKKPIETKNGKRIFKELGLIRELLTNQSLITQDIKTKSANINNVHIENSNDGKENFGQQTHVHFKDGPAINIDGSFKHWPMKGGKKDHGWRPFAEDQKLIISWGFLLPDNFY